MELAAESYSLISSILGASPAMKALEKPLSIFNATSIVWARSPAVKIRFADLYNFQIVLLLQQSDQLAGIAGIVRVAHVQSILRRIRISFCDKPCQQNWAAPPS